MDTNSRARLLREALRPNTPGYLAIVFVASMVLCGLGLGCKKNDEPSPPSPSAKLPPLEIVDGEAKPSGSAPAKVVRIDREALKQACAAANLPAPPDLTKLDPRLAQIVYDSINAVVEEPSAAAFGRLGHLYHVMASEQKDLLRAVECYGAAKAFEPEAFEWPYRLGKVFVDRGSTERADLEFDEAEKLNPKYAMIHWLRGRIDLGDNRPDRARAHFERLVELKPDDSLGYTGIGHAHLLAGDYEAALEALQQAVKLQPDEREAHELLGQVHLYLGQAQLADQERKTAGSLPRDAGILERDPLELAAWTQLPLEFVRARIDSLMPAGNVRDAVTLCESVLEDHPKDDALLAKLAWLRLQLGNPNEALDMARGLLSVNPANFDASAVLVDCHLALGEPDEALAVIEQALKSDDTLAVAHSVRGRILFQTRRYSEAEAAFRRATELEPSNAGYWRMLTDALMVQDKKPSAKECCRRILDLDPADPPARPVSAWAYFVLARILVGEGLLEEAAKNFKGALRINPDNELALAEIGAVLAKQGKVEEALAHMRQVVESRPASASLRVSLGELLMAAGRDAEAIEHLLKAVQIVPEHAGAHYLLGILRNRNGDPAAAKKHYEQAIKSAPTFVDAYFALSMLARQAQARAAAEQYLRDGLKNVPDAVALANALAWTLATDPDPTRRNGEEAVRWAEKACESAQQAHPSVLDTLAAAYAEVGRFDEAVKTERDAIKRATDAGQEALAKEYGARLALYEAGMPYHED